MKKTCHQIASKSFDVNNNWYIAGVVQAYLYPGEKLEKSGKRREVWESYFLIRARNSDEALKKAYAIGMLSDGMKTIDGETGREYECRFVGLSEIMPVYDDLEDGCEVLWYAGSISLKKAMSLVVRRGALAKKLKMLDAKASR